MTDQPRPDRQPVDLPASFLAHSFPPELELVYVQIFNGLRHDSEARPGMRTLNLMTAERAAHTFTQLKSFDAQEDRVYPPDYARTAKTFSETVKNLLASVKDGDDDQALARLAATQITRSMVEAVDASVDDGLLTEDDAAAIMGKVRARLAEVVSDL